MVKRILVAVLLTGFTYCTKAQEKIYLYPEQKGLHIGGKDKVQEAPFIEHFGASSKNGAAVLVIPGGGYTFLADGHEGKDIAQFFNSKGYDAIVLHYRINDDAQQGARYPAQYNDAMQAMRMIKSKAADWGLNPDKIGVIGFSAGGHLASCVATMIQPGTKPAFAVLVYPVISMDTPYKHAGSATMLLGPQPAPGMVDSLSTQNRVSEQTPPTMLIHSTDDKVVPIENSLLFYNALRAHHVPATLHVYDHGGHGYGLGVKDPVLNSWPELCITWLQGLGIK